MEKKDVYELTNPQKNIWSTEQYFSGTNINNVCGRANITEKVNFAVLKDAIQVVLKTNASFLINFKLIDGNLFQYTVPYHFFDIKIVDVQTEEDVKALEKELYSKVYKLEDKFLYDTVIYKFPNETGGFFLNTHHLLGDSWSLGLYCKKVIQAYMWLLENNKTANDVDIDTIPGMASNYIDYCNAEKEYLSSPKFEKDKQYWNEKFETVPEVASLPSISKKDSKLSCKGARKSFNFSPEVSKKINEYCKANNISNFNFITAIYSLYISRCCNLDDFVIGTPLLNRTNFAEKNMEGMFVSTAPLRINLKEATSFTDLAKTIAKDSMGMLRHQKYPYEYLLKDLRAKEPNLPNLYNILISYQITKTTIDGLKHDTYWAFNGTCADELQMHILDLNDYGTLNISYQYKTDKYQEQEILDLHKRIEYIINQVLEKNDIELNNIEIVTPAEKDEILNKFNNTNVDYPKDKTIVDLFEEQVEKTPNNIALSFEGEHLTYKELNEKANQLANYLRGIKIKNNDIIGVSTSRSFEMIISILAVLKSGAAYIPIDPEYPNERVAYMLENSKAKIVITNNELFKNISQNTIFIELIKSKLTINNSKKTINTEKLAINNPAKISKPNDLSYIIYTSGSTGKPKGVMLTQSNFTNLYYGVCQNVAYLKDKQPHSIASITTISFDIFAFESIISLTKGLHVFITNAIEQKITSKLENLIKENNIEIIQTTPSTMSFHLNSVNNIKNLKSLKYIILAGEQLPKTLVDKLKKAIPNVTIYNGYGPSETTIFSTITNVTNEEAITIGKPIVNTQIYILDNSLNLLPKNHLGEIYISGDGVGKGYLYNKDLTSSRFINDPFKKGQTMYKVGDLGFYRDDGKIECKGRCDFQVKLRGLRIELEEIEEVIKKYDTSNITECAVLVLNEGTTNAEKIIAFISSKKTINQQELKLELIKHLPTYMIPNEFIMLESLPHTPNGKIDRKALGKYKIEPKETRNICIPNTKTEKEIAIMVSSICNTNNISIDDDYYTLGLDSFEIIKLSSMLMEKYKIELPVSMLYSLYNIKKTAEYIDKLIKKEDIHTILPIKPKDSYPLSSAQKRIYYTDKMIGENNLVYNTPGALIINKKLDAKKVEKVFNTIIEKQSSYRTSFIIENTEVKQKINENIKIKIPIFNNKENELDTIISNFPKPFNLEKAPLLRIELHFIDNKKTLLLLDSHHIIMDGMSLSILIEEFCKLYNDEEIELSSIDYIDYSVWENNYIKSDEFKKSEQYWLNKFKETEFESLNLPYDYNIPNTRNYEGKTISNNFAKTTFEKYIDYAKNIGISPYMFFISAFFVLLYKYTGQENITLGTPTIGRDNKQLKNIIGMFVNNLVLKAQINGNTTFEEFANSIKEQVVKDLAYQTYPYDMLVKKLNIPSNTSQNPLFDVMFIYQNTPMPKLTIDKTNLEIIKCLPNIAKFNLSMEIDPNERKISIEYRTDLFKEETIKRFFEHYTITLNKIITNKNISIKDISILSEKEKDLILNKFNDTKVDYPDKTVIELFEEQVEKNPNKIAVAFEDKQLTYKELNEKANNLSNYLNFIGLKETDTISINLHRSLDLIIAIYAVIKTGATYILIDPSLPQERIHYIVKDSNSRFGLVDKLTLNSLNIDNTINISNFDYKNYDSESKTRDLKPENLCIIYTSGSTGNPKGVLLHNKGFSNLIFSLDKSMEISSYKKILGIATVSFDMFAFELFTSTLHGNTLVLANEEEQRNSIAMSKLIKNNNVDFLVTTPSRIQLLLDEQCDNPLKNLSALLLGGEALTGELCKNLKKVTNAKIFNGYGPTEITACCTSKLITPKSITIGKPMPNYQVYICDTNINLLPIGITGEICVAGKGIATGYLNNKEATSKKFIKNPFGEGYIYKTGDLGKYNKKGEIEFQGRTDFQIKIRGLRIELSEIETHLNSLSSIEKSVVLYNNVDNFAYLTAFVTSKDTINVHDIKTQLAKKIPNYMIPRYIIQLDNFPITINGKVDKKKLSDYKFETTSNINNYIEPTTEKQKIYCKIWNELLNIKVGIDDDLFDIGADSLLAIKFKSRLLAYNIDIPYSDIFKYRTIRNLCNIESIENTSYNNDSITNYNKINELLAKQRSSNLIRNKNSNVLLLGGTGFIGMHIINSFIRNNKGKIYCIVREKNKISSLVRFTELLHYYFGNTLDKYIDKRIFILNGDVLKQHFGLSIKSYNTLSKEIDTVINAVANVKHYGKKESFIEANIHSLQTAIDFSKKFNKRLIHISTLSISGNMIMLNPNANNTKFNKTNFTENDFYIGQSLDNVYTKSKFEAERLVYNEIINNNLNAQVLRLGNITNRYTDGLFQINTADNAFVNKIKSFLELKILPNYLMNNYIEFTPVDYCAKAIINVLNNNYTNRYVYHIYNDNHLLFSQLIKYLKRLDEDIIIVEDREFNNKIQEILSTNQDNVLSGIINDFDNNKKLNYSSYINIKGEATKRLLEKSGFRWPNINKKYIKTYINYFRKINFIK